MPKWLKFIFNFFVVIGVIVTLLYLGPLLYIFFILMKRWLEGIAVQKLGTALILLSLPLFVVALNRVPIILGEFLFVRPYLGGQHVMKEYFKINIYTFGFFIGSFYSTLYVLRKLYAIFQINYSYTPAIWSYLFWALLLLVMILVGVAEVYIKTHYFKEYQLTTNPKKISYMLSAIIIPVYILWVVGWGSYLYIKFPYSGLSALIRAS